jgi:phage minor structural protein
VKSLLGDIDLNKKIIKPQLFLCKPSRKIIAKLNHVFPPRYVANLGNINELEFDLPYKVDIDHKLTRYKPIDLIRTRYLIKFVLGNKTEWFIIDKISDDGSDENIKHVHAYSLGYQLRDKRIRNYQVESYTLSQLVNDALSKTNWSIGFVDPTFDNKYRSFDVSSQTVLEFIFDVAETFEALVDFDTNNKKLNFHKLDDYGQNKGLVFSYGKYLKSINRDIDTANVFTRIIPYGDNDLSIRGVNPTGLDYIDDFSYYLYPFERDENRNVIRHSYYMSDELCHAILDYGELVNQHKDSFKNLNDQKSTLQQQLTEQQNTLTDLQTKLTLAQDEQDIQKGMETFSYIEYTYSNKSQTNNVSLNEENKYAIMVYVSSKNNLTIKVNNTALSLADNGWVIKKINNTSNVSIVSSGSATNVNVKIYVLKITDDEFDAEDNDQVLLEKYNDAYLQSLINSQQAVVDNIQSQIDDIDLQITQLKNILDVKNNFTPELIDELNDYVFEYEWTDTNYIDAQELYDDAVEKLKKLNAPPTVINIDIVDFLSNVESQRDWDKLVLGDYVTIKYDEFDLKIEAQIISIEYDFKDKSIKLTIANLKDVKDEKRQILDQLYSNAVAGITVEMNKNKWDLAEDAKTSFDDLMNNVWDAAKREISAGVNESVSISGRGIVISNPNDPNKMLIAQSGVIALSGDGGKNWYTAIHPDGIIANRLIGQVIIGENLTMENESGKFSFTKDGVVLEGSSLIIKEGLPKDQIDPDAVAAWDSAEENAKRYADEQIDQVNSSLDNLESSIIAFSNDNYITLAEANALKNNLIQVNNESTDLINVALAWGITTERINYSNALSDLTNYLNNWIDKSNYPLAITTDQRNQINDKFKNVQNYKSILINKITDVQSQNASQVAKEYTDQQISEVNTSLDNLQSSIDAFSSDNFITLAEANALKTNLTQVNNESIDLINVATWLGISTEKDNYSNSLADLTNFLNNWIDKTNYPLPITSDQRNQINDKFKQVQNAKSILINKITSVQSSKAIDIAKEYTNQQISEVNTSIDNLQTSIDNFSSDSYITLAEANSLKINLTQVNNESTDLINVASGLGITTEKTNYSNAVSDLTSFLTNWIDKTNYPIPITTSQRDQINDKFKQVQNAKSILINKITAIQSQAGKDAWSKFSGAGNTLPAGNVEFNFAGSTSKGGNAINTDNVGNQPAVAVQNATVNFNNRNDRKSTTPANPVVATDGTAIDHTINSDGSADISFEWSFNGSGDAYDIDGFIIYVYQSTSNSPYTFGTSPTSEQVYIVTPDKRAFILYGVPADRYYTFGVQAYRTVDQDINPNGIIKSSIVKSTATGENPYRPSSNVAFAGNITGTINGVAASTVSTTVNNFNNRNDRKATTPANPTVASDGTAIDHNINDDGSANISFEWSYNGSGDAYDIDGFIVYVRASSSNTSYTFGTNTSEEQTFTVPADKRSLILQGVAANLYYTFGVQAYRIVDNDINASGVLKSSIVKSTASGENPYQPSSTVAFVGDVTGTINGTDASVVATAAENFNDRNDRNSTIPANPTIATDGSAIDHTINTDGSADISFEWSYNGSGDAYDIDGFIVYVYSSTSNTPYTFGTTPSAETIYTISSDKRSFILAGVAADKYYTFGVQAYRIVDQDIDSDGILKSSIVKSTASGENPYRPSSSVAFAGNITGTVNGTPASTLTTAVINFNNRNDRKSTPPANPTIASDGSAIDHVINTDGSANISFEWNFDGTGDAYDIDGFIVYVYQSISSSPYNFGTSVAEEQVFYMTSDKRAFILYGVPSDKYYTFGVQAYRIVDPDINSSGVLKSSIVKSTATDENPYRPSANVAFNGNIIGSIAGVPASTVVVQAGNSVQQGSTYNGVKIDTQNGLVVTRNDGKVKTTLNATEGIKIQSLNGSTWEDKFYVDTTGKLIVKNIVIDNGNSGVNIDDTGVVAKNSSFFLQDAISNTKYSLIPLTNYITDSSFEIVEYNDSVATYADKLIFPVQTNYTIKGYWDYVGTPYVQLTDDTYFGATIFGGISGIVNNANYFKKSYIIVKSGGTYTLSCFFKKSALGSGGIPKMVAFIENDSGSRIWSQSFQASNSVTDSVVRYSLTFTLPSNITIGYDAGNSFGVEILSANSSWIMIDGVQLVEGSYPVYYNDNSDLWSFMNGARANTIQASNFYAISGGIDDFHAVTITTSNISGAIIDQYGNIQAKNTVSSGAYWNMKDYSGKVIIKVPWGSSPSPIFFYPQRSDHGIEIMKLDSNSSGDHIGIRGAGQAIIKFLSSSDTIQIRTTSDQYYADITASAFNTSSLAKYKQDIEPWSDRVWDIVKNMTLYRYRLKTDVEKGIDKIRYGFVIGDGYDTPEIIMTSDGEGVEQYLMNSLSLKISKEQIQEIEELKAKNEEQSKQIEELKAEIEVLKQKMA